MNLEWRESNFFFFFLLILCDVFDQAHGTIPSKLTKKPSLLARLFGTSGESHISSPSREISTPTSVVHTSHAGFDATTGSLAQRDLPPEWHSLFSNAQLALLHSKQQQAAAAANIQGQTKITLRSKLLLTHSSFHSVNSNDV